MHLFKMSLLFLGSVFMASYFPIQVDAQNTQPAQDYYKADVVSIEEEEGKPPQVQVKVIEGEKKGEELTVGMLGDAKTQAEEYQVGDQVIILHSQDQQGNDITYIVDRVRLSPLIILFVLFVAVAIAVGRWHGLLSLVGMGFSFLIIIQFIIPQIVLGNNPILIALLGGLIITPLTFYTSHGFKRKTTIAVAGTFIALVLTGFLSWVFVEMAHLTGFTGDDSVFIQTMVNQAIDMRSLLLAGMIIGVMGILDDITVSQSSLVFKLAETNPTFSFRKLFFHAMDVGKDHIASLVNTLILVYAGASLPLFLLFYNSEQPLSMVLNNEIIATELVRMFVGSIGLIAAVPITTFIACLMRK
jgi:uncharacterized membrane protein